MKLLIVTQVIDTEHSILGFFHRWVEEFAKHCEHVHVIALQVGKYDLPDNVTVHSLGKEAGKSKLIYLWRFYSLICTLRSEYDNVFVHMNQIYVILGAPVWRVCGRKVGLWYAHGAVTISLYISAWLSDSIFTSTQNGMRINTLKRKIVGQGIDTDIFTTAPKSDSKTLRLITVGRITESKNIDTLLKACGELKKQKVKFVFKVIGAPMSESEKKYQNTMEELADKLNIAQEVEWTGAVSNFDLSPHLQQSDIFIHDGSTNSLDKTLLEAALCGCVVVSSNPSYKEITKDFSPELLFMPRDEYGLSKILAQVSNLDLGIKEAVMKQVVYTIRSNHSVEGLISGIVTKF